jgi:Kef-type K+ transport system membrane component KefB
MTGAPLALIATDSAGIAKVLLQVLIIFGSTKLLAEIAERLRQPSVVGELAAGILIGPAVLGWVAPSDVLSVLAELGVMFLLFRVGLELSDFRLAKIGLDALAVAVCGVVLPFFAGMGTMLAVGQPEVEAIFVGAALVATSVGITARVLADKGLLQQRASKIILAAAVIDDVLGLLVLAVVSGVAKGRINFLELALTTVLAAGFTLLVATWGTRTMRVVLPHMARSLQSGGAQFTLSILLLFGLSLLATYAGVAAIIGAFLAGMALSGSVEPRIHEMTSGAEELLVPFFLAGIGLNLDLSVFRHGGTVVLGLLLLVVACASKFVGCGLGALRLGWSDAARVGTGMIPRGEVGLVVAQIGLGLRVIPPAVYALVVVVAIGTTVVAPPLLQIAYRKAPPAVRLSRTGSS